MKMLKAPFATNITCFLSYKDISIGAPISGNGSPQDYPPIRKVMIAVVNKTLIKKKMEGYKSFLHTYTIFCSTLCATNSIPPINTNQETPPKSNKINTL